MPDSIDGLLGKAIINLRIAHRRSNIMTGPVETWRIPLYLDALGYAILSLENLNEALKWQGTDLPAFRALLRSEAFYQRMLGLGHNTIGSAIRALNKHEVPEGIVESACAYAYLHEPVRDAILAGYGITAPEPSKKPI